MEETAELSRPELPLSAVGQGLRRLLEFELARSAAGADIGLTGNGTGVGPPSIPAGAGRLQLSRRRPAGRGGRGRRVRLRRDGSGGGPRRYDVPMALARSHVHAERSDLWRIESRCLWAG